MEKRDGAAGIVVRDGRRIVLVRMVVQVRVQRRSEREQREREHQTRQPAGEDALEASGAVGGCGGRFHEGFINNKVVKGA